MRPFRPLSNIEQLVAHLRGEIMEGHLSGAMPGVGRLVQGLGVGTKTVLAALEQLEREGFLVHQGPCRRRRILLPEAARKAPRLRIAILNHEPLELLDGFITGLLHALQQAGHDAFFTPTGLVELRMDAGRVARLVRETDADAWVIHAGSSEVLGWFVKEGIPAFALGGRRRELMIAGAGPDKVRTYREVVRRLVALGHRRIVLLALKSQRLPEPGASARAFLDELAAQKIPSSHYNLPDWEESPEGIRKMVDSLFRVTPPTALLLDEAYLFHAVKHHLAHREMRVPQDVSLICTDPDRTFAWCQPSIAHIAWDSRPIVRRIMRWAENLSLGRQDLGQTLTVAKFVEGGTMGPVKA